jgi:hypothetical protein
MNFRWCLDGYLLSILESILQQSQGLYIKINLQIRKKIIIAPDFIETRTIKLRIDGCFYPISSGIYLYTSIHIEKLNMYIISERSDYVYEIDHFFWLTRDWKKHTGRSDRKKIGIPVFAKDWLEATLLRCGLQSTIADQTLGFVGYELLTILAQRQLMLGQSVILDSVAASQNIRLTWKELARQYQAHLYIIECVCSEPSIHRARLKERRRNIPGWHELEWSEVERVQGYYLP